MILQSFAATNQVIEFCVNDGNKGGTADSICFYIYIYIFVLKLLYHFAMPPFSTSHKLSNCPSVAIAPRTLRSKMRGVRMRKSAALKKLELVGESGTPFIRTQSSAVWLYGALSKPGGFQAPD